jgi:crotonobetainyl-CoA:carnitine CoA-transferase CaiB-like acyl-CoA transferase
VLQLADAQHQLATGTRGKSVRQTVQRRLMHKTASQWELVLAPHDCCATAVKSPESLLERYPDFALQVAMGGGGGDHIALAKTPLDPNLASFQVERGPALGAHCFRDGRVVSRL